jgi:hypothetical protein
LRQRLRRLEEAIGVGVGKRLIVVDAKSDKTDRKVLRQSVKVVRALFLRVVHTYSTTARFSTARMSALAMLKSAKFSRRQVNDYLKDECRDFLTPKLRGKTGDIVSSYMWKNCCLGAAAALRSSTRIVFETHMRCSSAFARIQRDLTDYLAEPGVLTEVSG